MNFRYLIIIEMIACCFNSFGCHIIGLPQDMHQALISYTDIAAIRNYKNTCKKLYDNVHFHMASDYSIASMATVTCLRGLIAFAQQQDQMRVKEKDSPCDNIQNNFMRFLSRSGIKEYLATELVLQRIGSRMTMVLNKACLFSGISVEAGEQKTLFKNNDAQDIATKLILYAKHYEPSNMHNNECPLLINIFKSYKKNLFPLLLAHPRVDVNLQDKYGNTALMIACVDNHIEVVKVLLADSRVDVNLQDKLGYTALTLAFTHSDIEVVKVLLAHQNVNINQQNKWGYTALMRACTCNLEIVKQLLADPNININQQNEDGYTAFMLACKHNNIEAVKILLADQKVNVNQQNTDGYTAFMLACKHNNIEVVKILLADQKVNVNQHNSDGDTALMKACIHNNMEIVKQLLADPNINVNLQDKDGSTALIKACCLNNIEAVKVLLTDSNIKVNLQDKDSDTALMTACYLNNIEAVKELLADPRVDVNLQDTNGYTALMTACLFNKIEVVKALIAAPNINVNLHNSDGNTAFMACEYNHREIVEILLAHQYMWPLDKIVYNLYLKYGLSAAKIIVLLGKGIVVSSLLLGLLYYAH